MCFDSEEVKFIYYDLKNFFEKNFYTPKNDFELKLKKILDQKYKVNNVISRAILKNIHTFSQSSNINCCLNFISKLFILDKNSRCNICTRSSENLRERICRYELKRNSDLQLNSLLCDKQYGLVFNNKIPAFAIDYEKLIKREELTNDLNSLTNKSEKDLASLTYRCSNYRCLACTSSHPYLTPFHGCSTYFDYYYFRYFKFQDLQLPGLIAKNIEKNFLSKDYYDLLDRIKWNFDLVDKEMITLIDKNTTIPRKLLVTMLPVTLPYGIKIICPSKNKNNSTETSKVWIRFYFDPKVFVPTNIFGRDMIRKLNMKFDFKNFIMKFHNNDAEFFLKEKSKANSDLYSNLSVLLYK